MSPLEDGGPLAQLNKRVIRVLIVDLVTCTSLIPKLWKESQILTMKMWMLKCWEGLIVKNEMPERSGAVYYESLSKEKNKV